MSILNITPGQTGLVGVLPSVAYINTTDSEASVLTTGYLNREVQQGVQFSLPCLALVSTKETPTSAYQVGWYQVVHVGTNWSLVPGGNPGDVVLPTKANHIAVFTNTTGTLGEDPAIAISGGNIQAGLSGTAGWLESLPPTALSGGLRVTAVDSAGNFLTTISNASMGQSTTVSIPDPGAISANFILNNSIGGQTILNGLVVGTGNFVVAAGNISAGATGAAGTLTSFAGTGSAQFVRVAAVNNAGGNFSTTISNAASVGQSQVISIPDVGAATGQFLAKTAALVNGNLIQASGTAGLTVDSGVATTNVQLKTQVKAAATADIGGAGAGPISVVVAGLTAASRIVATIASSSNTVAVGKCIATATGFDITFTGDPGASCVVNYVAYVVAQ